MKTRAYNQRIPIWIGDLLDMGYYLFYRWPDAKRWSLEVRSPVVHHLHDNSSIWVLKSMRLMQHIIFEAVPWISKPDLSVTTWSQTLYLSAKCSWTWAILKSTICCKFQNNLPVSSEWDMGYFTGNMRSNNQRSGHALCTKYRLRSKRLRWKNGPRMLLSHIGKKLCGTAPFFNRV